MKKIYGICVSLLFATQLNASTEQEVKAATEALLRIVNEDPYNAKSIEKAVIGADLTHVKTCGTVLHELLYSANRHERETRELFLDASKKIQFPLASLRVLLNAGASPVEVKEYFDQYGKRYLNKPFVEEYASYQKLWPDLYGFMNDWIAQHKNT